MSPYPRTDPAEQAVSANPDTGSDASTTQALYVEQSGEAAVGANATETAVPETSMHRFRRNALQVRLHAYAIGLVALAAILIALAASNTTRVKVNWLIGSSRVSLVWLVLAAAVLGWLLGLLTSVRFQWLTRAPKPGRPADDGHQH